jgi:hypothetical protein
MKPSYRSIGAAILAVTAFALAPRAFSAELTLPRDGWASWQVAAVDGAPDWCCWSWNGGKKARDAAPTPCRLDGEQHGYGNRNDATTDAVRVYARTVGGQVDRLRVLSTSCPVETATPIRDLGSVADDVSARWLVDLTKQVGSGTGKHRDVGEDVLAALAINRGVIAHDALVAIARNDASEERRKEAVFWLALLRGREGADIAASAMVDDKNPDVRQHAAFALAHAGAPDAENAIVAAARNDQDDEARDGAIFALSQLPDERAPRALIAAAEDRSLSREQRKRAVFWLAQSESDAAQAYLEKVLTATAAD